MRIYICGGIANKEPEEVVDDFDEAKDLFAILDWDAITPIVENKPLTVKRLSNRIDTMLECDAVFVAKDWMDDSDSRIEHFVAHEKNMQTLYEENIEHASHIVNVVVRAIRKVTGFSLLDYSTPRKSRALFFARMLFVHHCSVNGVKAVEMAKYINRDHATISYTLNKYHEEYAFNKTFARMSDDVAHIIDKILNNNVS